MSQKAAPEELSLDATAEDGQSDSAAVACCGQGRRQVEKSGVDRRRE